MYYSNQLCFKNIKYISELQTLIDYLKRAEFYCDAADNLLYHFEYIIT